MRLWGLAGKRIWCPAIAGGGVDFAGAADKDGGLAFELPAPFSYALYRYCVLGCC